MNNYKIDIDTSNILPPSTGTPVKRYVMILAESDSLVQGIIRSIEKLDKEHSIGIIHGAKRNKVEDVDVILAELANAVMIVTDSVQRVEHPTQGKVVTYYMINLPQDVLSASDYNEVIDYITNPANGIAESLIEGLIKI